MRPELAEAFIRAAQAAGYPRNPDYNGGGQESFGYYQVNQKKGRRISAEKACLAPARKRPHLRVETNAHILRPESVGSIHLCSADPYAQPAIAPNVLSSPADLIVMRRGMQIARDIMGQKALAPYIADASVVPTVVAGNTRAALCMIAEKAADLIPGSVS